MIPPLTNGKLPVGRFPADAGEVEQRFVNDPAFVASTTRAQVWSDWQQVATGARTLVPVCAVWLGGSFLTDKVDPDDLDVVWLIDSRQLLRTQADPSKAPGLSILGDGPRLRSITGLRVDTYVCPWVPDPGGTGAAPGFAGYAQTRGYWDDFWQRSIAGAKTGPRVPADALPKRGYLEVTLDGYTA